MQDELLRQWGENIRLRRMLFDSDGEPVGSDASPMTQTDLGALLTPPVHQTTVARWENGLMEPRRRYKAQLASVLRTDVRILFPMTAGVA